LPEETPDHFDFSEKMQVGLLRAFCKVEFFEKHFDTARPEHFENELLAFLAETILNWQRKYHDDMPKEVLLEEIRKAEPERRGLIVQAITDTVNELYGSKVPEKYIDNNYQEWARDEAFRSAFLKGSKLISQRRWHDIHRIMDEAYFSTDGYDLGHMFLGGGEDRVKRRLTEREERIPTMIQQLDHMLKGGGERKNVVIVMGEPKKGKSFLLTNVGKGAIVMGYKVTHYTLESGMPERRVADRYDALFSGINMDELREASDILIAAIEKAKEKYGESLCIKEYPPVTCTVDTIRAHQKRLIATGFSSDLIIVDYADVLKASEHRDSKWEEVGGIFDDLGRLAAESNVLVWVASGTRRGPGGAKQKRVKRMEDVGAAYKKMYAGDIIISLNQTEQEEKEHILRVNLVGARNIPYPEEITVSTDFSHARFAKPESFDEDEFTERKDLF